MCAHALVTTPETARAIAVRLREQFALGADIRDAIDALNSLADQLDAECPYTGRCACEVCDRKDATTSPLQQPEKE